MARRMKIEYERADGRRVLGHLPKEIGWTAARAIAREKGGGVTLYGELGAATFGPDGSGVVVWGEGSNEPGVEEEFGPRTTVMIERLDKMSRKGQDRGMNAKELKRIREKLNMTQPDLAKRLKVSWRTVARWEAGQKIPETVRLALKEVQREEGALA